MNNKLTIEEQFLTLDQAKELQALEIDMEVENLDQITLEPGTPMKMLRKMDYKRH